LPSSKPSGFSSSAVNFCTISGAMVGAVADFVAATASAQPIKF
jgi:hypothetical protein